MITMVRQWLNTTQGVLNLRPQAQTKYQYFVVDVQNAADSIPFMIFGHANNYKQINRWHGFPSAYEIRVDDPGTIRVCWRVATGFINNVYPPANHPRNGMGAWQERIDFIQNFAVMNGLQTGNRGIIGQNEKTRAVAIFDSVQFKNRPNEEQVNNYLNNVLEHIRNLEEQLRALPSTRRKSLGIY